MPRMTLPKPTTIPEIDWKIRAAAAQAMVKAMMGTKNIVIARRERRKKAKDRAKTRTDIGMTRRRSSWITLAFASV